MLLNELFLQEDNAEMKDLMAIANYVARWMHSNENLEDWDGNELQIIDIQGISRQKMPDIKTATVKWLLFRPVPERTRIPLRFVTHLPNNTFKNERGSYFPAPYHSINVNLDLIVKRKGNVASTVLHELQHALDDMKSSGKIRSDYTRAETNFKQYLQHPAEINARLSQALWDMTAKYDAITKGDMHSKITSTLTAHKLTPDIIPDTKQYKKLIVRSYKFLDEVGHIIDNKQEPGFVQKVKNLIKKWVS